MGALHPTNVQSTLPHRRLGMAILFGTMLFGTMFMLIYPTNFAEMLAMTDCGV